MPKTKRPKPGAAHDFTLEELLAECDPNAPTHETTVWETRAPAGDEIL